jgi:adenylate kinase family enzyme
MRRVAVVGPGGAGKTTFSRRLGERLGVPVVHLDRHHWKPGWTEPAPDEWAAQQAELLTGDAWIADGNYGRTFDLRFARADTVIVLTLPPLRCVAGVLRRWATNFGQDIQAGGCPERVNLAFLRWIWRYPKDSRPRLDAAIERHREHLRVVELRSRREAAAFLDDLIEPPDARGA